MKLMDNFVNGIVLGISLFLLLSPVFSKLAMPTSYVFQVDLELILGDEHYLHVLEGHTLYGRMCLRALKWSTV